MLHDSPLLGSLLLAYHLLIKIERHLREKKIIESGVLYKLSYLLIEEVLLLLQTPIM